MKKLSRILLVAVAIAAMACQRTPQPDPQPATKTEWISRPEAFQEKYTLDQMVVLSRHNIRSPLVSKNSVLTRLTNNNYQWFNWEGEPSSLTPKGARLEAQMGRFFGEWLTKKDILNAYSKDKTTFRFYANAKQRCQVSAREFADALLPGKNPTVEMNVPFDTMDPVFHPQITKLSDSFTAQAQEEIHEMLGDLDAGIAAGYAMLERVIDITHAPAYPDTTSFSQFPSSVGYKLNAEPFMNGGLKMACTVSDALSLQYYEEPDEQKAAFGQNLSFADWVTVSSVKEWYGEALFGVPTVAINVAHPMLKELLEELQNQKRRFTFLCGHDSNLSSVMTALGAELPDLPGSTEKRTPIGGKLIFECFNGADGNTYADLLLVYASAEQLRAVSTLTYDNPPMGVKVTLSGLSANADGLYRLADVEQRLSQAIQAYDTL